MPTPIDTRNGREVTLVQAVDAMRPYARSQSELERLARSLVNGDRTVVSGGRVVAYRVGPDTAIVRGA